MEHRRAESGSPDSGSMQHDVDGAADNAKVWCAQCVPVTELTGYVASAWHYWPDDPDVMQVGSTRLSVYYYSDVGCSLFVEVGANSTGNHPLLDTWYHLETDESIAPTGAMTALVYFITWQNFRRTRTSPTRRPRFLHHHPLSGWFRERWNRRVVLSSALT